MQRMCGFQKTKEMQRKERMQKIAKKREKKAKNACDRN